LQSEAERPETGEEQEKEAAAWVENVVLVLVRRLV
jgi:hypothetical protein